MQRFDRLRKTSFPPLVGRPPGSARRRSEPVRPRRLDMARAFKVRSAERDAQTDSERLGSVSAAIGTAIASIRKERDALRGRVDAARDQAAFATGTDYDEYLTRDAKDAARIKEYEQQMASGEKRTEELERQLGGLDAILEVFNRHFAGKLP
jgi:chromosome segregation ATPase